METKKQTDQTNLKRALLKDLPFIYGLVKHPELKGRTRNRSLFSIFQYVEDLRSDKRIIVFCGERVSAVRLYKSEVSILILPEYQHKGIGSGVMKRLMREKHRLKAVVANDNLPSQAFFQKLGFEEIEHDHLDVTFEWIPKGRWY